jgi:FG-GAP repeat
MRFLDWILKRKHATRGPLKRHSRRPAWATLQCERLEDRLAPALGNPLQTFTDPGNSVNDAFGNSVAFSGSDVLVGAWQVGGGKGAAYLYNTSGTLLATFTDPNGATTDLFGYSVALSGSDVLVGAYGVNGQHGAAYLYNTSGTLLQTFTSPNSTTDDFGISVALSGSDVLVGAETVVVAYLYGDAAAVNVLAGNGEAATVGTAFATAPSVAVVDAQGNPVSGALRLNLSRRASLAATRGV